MPFAVAAGIGAVGSIASGLIGADAASNAADTQAAAADRAAQMSMQQFQQTRGDFAPYRDTGATSLGVLSSTLFGGTDQYHNALADQGFGLTNRGAAKMTFDPTQAQLESTPGYQFIRDQGLQAVQSGAAARGLGVSGAAMKGAARFAEGLAGTTLGQQQQIFQQNLANVMNPLQSMVNMGQSAAGQIGNFGQSATSQAAQAGMSGAASQAAGMVGSANAYGGALNTAASAPMNYMMYNKLLGDKSGGSIWGGGGGGGYIDNQALIA